MYKNEWKELKIWQQKIEKSNFYKNKEIFNIDDIDVNKILVSKKEPYGKKNALKYFIAYNDNDVIRPLWSFTYRFIHIRLLQMTGYINKFKENTTTTMSLNV